MAKPEQVNVPPKSKKDTFRERLSSKRPDLNMDDEESFYGALSEEYDQYDKQIGQYKDNEKKITDMFSSDPRSASFLQKWADGGDPAMAMVEEFGDEFMEAINDHDKRQALTEARQKYLDKVAQNQKYEEEFEGNLTRSLQTIEDYARQNNMSDEDIDSTMEDIMKFVKDVVSGTFTPDMIDKFRKAASYDTDVAQAGMEGEVRGRNQKITEKKRTAKRGDGMPSFGGMNTTASPQPPKNQRDLGQLKQMSERKSVWDQ